MKEIKSILKLYKSYINSNEKCAIAQVVRVEESSYRREGARMLVFESGVFEGGISVTYDTSKENEIGVGLGCNGVIDVLISPISENSSTLQMLQKCVSDRGFHIIATVTSLNSEIDSIPLGRSFYYDKDSASLEDCEHVGLRNFLQDKIQDVLKNQKSKTYHFNEEAVKANLHKLIKSTAPYIASLGPRKRFDKMLSEFKVNGIELTKQEIDRVFAPCGLEIGANTPEEIALSLFSEILSVFTGNTGGMLRNKVGPIHERN